MSMPIPVGLKLEYLRVSIVPGVAHVEEELLRAREHALDVVHVEPIELNNYSYMFKNKTQN